VVVKRLPSKVGILEITLFTQDRTSPKALLKKGRKAKLSAAVKPAGGRWATLKTTVKAQRH
jgi:hypothetical protein